MFFHLQTWDDNSQVTFKFGPDAHSNHQVSTFSSLARSAIVVSIFSVSTMGGVIVLTARMKTILPVTPAVLGAPRMRPATKILAIHVNFRSLSAHHLLTQ